MTPSSVLQTITTSSQPVAIMMTPSSVLQTITTSSQPVAITILPSSVSTTFLGSLLSTGALMTTFPFPPSQLAGAPMAPPGGHPTTENSARATPMSQLGEIASALFLTTSSTSIDSVELETYRTYPSISTGEVSSITTDGHIETTGSDRQPSRVPVLNPHCFFCPPAIKFGVALFGLLPGVYPPGPPPLPGWKITFPRITIGKNGDPTYSSPTPTSSDPKPTKADVSLSEIKPSTKPNTEASSSSGCTISVTASICSQILSYGIDKGGRTTTTLSSRSCSATVGCGAQETFTTRTVTSQASCPSIGYIPFSMNEEIVDENEEEAIMPPSGDGTIQERSGTSANAFGIFQRAKRDSFDFSKENCPLQTVKALGWPKVSSLSEYKKAKAWFVTRRRDNDCGPWELALVADPVGLTAGTVVTKDAFGKPYKFPDAPVNRLNTNEFAFLNADHAYEVKFLKEFFLNIMNEMPKGHPKYPRFQEFWNGINAASVKEAWPRNRQEPNLYRFIGKDGITRANTMFQFLPSTFPQFADFMGTDMELNEWKGALFEQGLTNIRQRLVPGKEASHWIEFLNYIAVAIDLIHHDDVVERFKRTNSRITLGFLTLSLPVCSPPANYTLTYQEWMVERFKSQAIEIEELYREIVAVYVRPDSLNIDDLAKYQRMTKTYPREHYTLDTVKFFHLDYTSQLVDIRRRQPALPDSECQVFSKSSTSQRTPDSVSALATASIFSQSSSTVQLVSSATATSSLPPVSTSSMSSGNQQHPESSSATVTASSLGPISSTVLTTSSATVTPSLPPTSTAPLSSVKQQNPGSPSAVAASSLSLQVPSTSAVSSTAATSSLAPISTAPTTIAATSPAVDASNSRSTPSTIENHFHPTPLKSSAPSQSKAKPQTTLSDPMPFPPPLPTATPTPGKCSSGMYITLQGCYDGCTQG
jgi:hypothetical protein